jgi:osmoprotectant transport system ATP-binding protein
VPVLKGTPRKVARAQALELLDTVGLTRDLANRYPAQLSGGQQQRVGVARGLAANPNILLMDEPFGAVDPIVRAELQQETIRLQRDLDKTVVFVTHDIDEAFLLGDQVVILEKGAKIAQVGSPSEIIANPASKFVADFIGIEHGKRALTIKKDGKKSIVVDSEGRAAGVLVDGSAQ